MIVVESFVFFSSCIIIVLVSYYDVPLKSILCGKYNGKYNDYIWLKAQGCATKKKAIDLDDIKIHQ